MLEKIPQKFSENTATSRKIARKQIRIQQMKQQAENIIGKERENNEIITIKVE